MNDELRNIGVLMAKERIRHVDTMAKLRVDFGALMRMTRTKKGLSLRELGKRLNLSAAYLGDIEYGRRSLSMSTLERLLEQL
jgi:ribosome-binding protein aMBF1 (putative translation factor)